jgi:hypothetical protein
MTSITPNMSDNPQANNANSPPSRVHGELGRLALECLPPFEQALQTGGDSQGLAHILLHQQHTEAGSHQFGQDRVDAAQGEGGKAEGGFIEEQHPGIDEQGTSNGDGLLFASRQLRGGLPAALLHPREQL